MRIFYKAGKTRLVAFTASGKWYVTAICKTSLSEHQRNWAARIGTSGTCKPYQLTFATKRKRNRFLRKIGAKVDWCKIWWWYIGRR
jgi:hypothetical protein